MTVDWPTYLAFEGGEGSGKSTQAAILAERVGAKLTHEPGATELGAELRRLLLNPGEAPVGARAETLMMAADRAQHLVEIVRPALDAGEIVVSDRTAYSSLAYQGGGRQLGLESVWAVNDWALESQWPELVIFLECAPDVAQARLGGSLDRLEQEGVDFHRRVQTAYLEMAKDNQETWVTVSADGTIDEVARSVWAAVGSYFESDAYLDGKPDA